MTLTTNNQSEFVVTNKGKKVVLTFEQISEVFQDWYCLYPEEDELVMTQDSLESFREASRDWRECRQVGSYNVETPVGDFTMLSFEGVQVVKGQQRHNIHVIDLETVRCVLKD